MNLTHMPGVLASIFTLALCKALNVPSWLELPIVLVVFVLATAAYFYTPLPNTNGGFGQPPARLQKWGFTNEPRHDYKTPSTTEMMSAGFHLAEKTDDEDTD